MRRSIVTTPTSSSSSTSCCFICKSPEEDELLLGKFHKKWRLRVHYHCLLLTSNLVQNGEDEEGIFGFLEEDIKNEEARIQRQKCYVCKERYANVSCCAKKCFRTFHTLCGMQNGCLSHYVGTFQSWCDKHVELVDEAKHTDTEVCGICYDEMGPYKKLESIRAPCCQNGWFHRRCVAQFAQSAGYFFKCPLCNNKDDFSQQMQQRGVYIPEKDASWELEPNAFSDQLERPSECDAEECRCRYGRDYDDCKRWDLILCATCGSTCRHDQCMDVPSKNYVCTFCRPIVGDEPPEAVLKLAEASRRAEAARRAEAGDGRAHDSGNGSSRATSRGRSQGRRQMESEDSDSGSSEIAATAANRKKRCIESSGSSSSSPAITNRKRKSQNRRTVLDSEASDSDVVSNRKKLKSQRRLSSTSSYSSLASSNDAAVSLEELVKHIALPRGASIEKLLRDKPVVKVERLSQEKIKTLTCSENEDDATSTGSSAMFDFNYRVKLNNKQRRQSMVELQQSIKEAIRSDTDTLTDASAGKEVTRPKTPAHKSFAKQFKMKLLGSKTVPRKRSTSESDPEHLPAKKPCATLNQPPRSKSRVSLFPPNNEENTCPNSPRKASIEPIVVESDSQIVPSPIKSNPPQQLSVFPPTPPASSSDNSSKPLTFANGGHHQRTLNSFFKKTPPQDQDEEGSAVSATVEGRGSGYSCTASGSAISATKARKSAKKSIVPKTRKKPIELDRSQRNLLDYFNRC